MELNTIQSSFYNLSLDGHTFCQTHMMYPFIMQHEDKRSTTMINCDTWAMP